MLLGQLELPTYLLRTVNLGSIRLSARDEREIGDFLAQDHVRSCDRVNPGIQVFYVRIFSRNI